MDKKDVEDFLELYVRKYRDNFLKLEGKIEDANMYKRGHDSTHKNFEFNEEFLTKPKQGIYIYPTGLYDSAVKRNRAFEGGTKGIEDNYSHSFVWEYAIRRDKNVVVIKDFNLRHAGVFIFKIDIDNNSVRVLYGGKFISV